MLINLIKKLRENEAGATAIEYGLIAALVSVVAIGALTNIGGGLDAIFGEIETEIGAAAPAGDGT